MNGQFTTLRMETLRAERNATTDNVDDFGASQRTAVSRAKAWQTELGKEIPSGTELTTFPGPHETGPVRELDWNPSDGVAPPYDPIDDATPAELEAVYGANDAAPSTLSFFNGREYKDGLKAYNEYLASKGSK